MVSRFTVACMYLFIIILSIISRSNGMHPIWGRSNGMRPIWDRSNGMRPIWGRSNGMRLILGEFKRDASHLGRWWSDDVNPYYLDIIRCHQVFGSLDPTLVFVDLGLSSLHVSLNPE